MSRIKKCAIFFGSLFLLWLIIVALTNDLNTALRQVKIITVFMLPFIVLGVVSFIQNMVFTWVSRSRNSGDPDNHLIAAYWSNSIWLVCQMFIFKYMWQPMMESSDMLSVAVGSLIYVYFTAHGSVYMMRIRLGQRKVPAFLEKYLVETGSKKVGERIKQ